MKIDPLTAHDSYGAWREGAHDDMVLAVAIAVWWGLRWRRTPRADDDRRERRAPALHRLVHVLQMKRPRASIDCAAR